MARFKAEDVNNYGGQGGSGFFGIAKNKEVKQVRFMYNTVDDIEGMSVHKVKINGRDRYVNCLRNYNDPLDVCPFCRDKYTTQARLFIPVYNLDENQVQIWDRGKTMFQKMASLCSRYVKKGTNLVNNVFEIERNGEPNDMKTTYEIYNIDSDDVELSDLPEVPEILGKVVLDKTAEDMEYFIEEGEFPPEDDEQSDAPIRRRDAQRSDSRPVRRTPASSTNRHRNDEDSF